MASDLPTFAFPSESPRIGTSPDDEAVVDETTYANDTLSPMSAHFSPGRGSPTKSYLSPYSPSSGTSDELYRTISGSGSEDGGRQPFNFKTQQYVVGRPPAAANKQAELGRRRGHKYARSSVSHQIILSPTPRLPLQLPTSLPMPTFKEFRASFTSEQRNRWLFCGLQLLVAGYVQFQAHESLAMTALSHLLFFDALSAVLCTSVDVGRNFEVWTTSSLRNPFGLERSELVAGLAMSIALLFMGLDLISHGLMHSLENTGGHEPHHAHTHDHASPAGIYLGILAAVLSTLVSTATLGNHTRIGRAIRPSRLPAWIPESLQNPSHLLTLSCSMLLLLLPILTDDVAKWFDMGLALLMALSMITLGGKLCYSLGCVLLMSFPARDSLELREVVSEIEADEAVSTVEEAKIWQVHYNLCMASFKIKARNKEAIERVKEKVAALVKMRLGEGGSAVKWEVSTMVSVDRD